MTQACKALRYPAPWTEQFLRALLERSTKPDIRGMACLVLARSLASRRSIAVDPWYARDGLSAFTSFMRQRVDAAWIAYITTTDLRQVDEEAERLFRRATEEFGQVVYARGAQGRKITVAEVARSEWTEFRKPAPGRRVPEIDADDAAGKRLRLSDFQGKVVVLCFGGLSDPRCRSTYTLLRTLNETYKHQPFAVLSVETDTDLESLHRALHDGTITWRCWPDRESRNPIAAACRVTAVPTLLILDRDGTIRFMNPRADHVEDQVRSLLPQADPGQN